MYCQDFGRDKRFVFMLTNIFTIRFKVIIPKQKPKTMLHFFGFCDKRKTVFDFDLSSIHYFEKIMKQIFT